MNFNFLPRRPSTGTQIDEHLCGITSDFFNKTNTMRLVGGRRSPGVASRQTGNLGRLYRRAKTSRSACNQCEFIDWRGTNINESESTRRPIIGQEEQDSALSQVAVERQIKSGSSAAGGGCDLARPKRLFRRPNEIVSSHWPGTQIASQDGRPHRHLLVAFACPARHQSSLWPCKVAR